MSPEEDMNRAVVLGGESWRTVGEIVTSAASYDDAVARLGQELGISHDGARAILAQPVSRWLPETLAEMRAQQHS